MAELQPEVSGEQRPEAAPERSATAPRPLPSYAWWLVLGLIGLDYFSTLAYLPSMAVEAADRLAPLAAAGVVLATLLGAVPIYLYVIGRSPHGTGATGLLERLVHGWHGKLLILFLLGFVATDFIITRSLSLADATVHLLHNPYWKDHVEWTVNNKETVRSWFPAFLQGRFFNFWDEQLVVTVVLAAVVFGFWALLRMGFTPLFLRLAIFLVAVYLLLNALVIGSGVAYLINNPSLFNDWAQVMHTGIGSVSHGMDLVRTLLSIAFRFFPFMALGLSGFELTMASAPLVRGRPDDDPKQPRGRIRNTRKLMLTAALIMSVFLLGSVFVTTLLVPPKELNILSEAGAATGKEEVLSGPRGEAAERALAYLAHGRPLTNQPFNVTLNPLFGPVFGTFFDLVTIAVLCLAGASVSIGMRDLLPHYLARYGMQLRWAQKIGAITHLFNIAILTVTLVFRASVTAQQWAYATSVLVLLTAAALAATLDVSERWQGSWVRLLAPQPFALIFLFFFGMTLWLLYTNASGLAIALILVLILMVTAFVSRWLRSTELRFEGFAFKDEHSRRRWEQIRELDFQVLVPHQPEHKSLEEKEHEVRRKHRLDTSVPIIFIEVHLGDPSEFYHMPLMEIATEDGREIIRVSRCNSVAHVLAAICLEFRHVGQPPDIYFNWSNESPIAANLHFLFMGQGNVPWMVHSLIRKAEPDVKRQPRVVIG